jgi:hypothetical protein
MGADEPTARNSNLLPVKANGEVRLRSVASIGRTGSEVDAQLDVPPLLRRRGRALLELLDDVLQLRAEEDRHDGRRRLVRAEAVVVARVGDRRAQQVGVDVDAADDGHRNARNWALACGSLPGSSRFSPSSVAIDQLLCLPEPLMPANGFSWMSSIRPCCWASAASCS